ncbi:MAG: stage II sporulation protein D [Oscillospiraceae bacterium]|nr:stage II sporulation protein D [Oscillospiraceae bacterium]
MKPFWKEVCFAAVMGLVVPAVLLGLAVKLIDLPEEQELTQVTERTDQTGPVGETQPAADPVRIDVLMDGTITSMELEEYLVGVVLAEMPVDFEEEARKAQAVVARTFTLRSREGGKHDNAAVCTDSGCCQAYLAPEDYLARGGTQEGIGNMRAAVEATAGEVLTYEGALIEATYFSCSGGSTEDAVAVWGTDVPYLRAVDSPGEENAAHYTDTVTFTRAEFGKALALDLTGEPESWLGSVTYTAGGGVDTMKIGGVSFSGTTLRRLLGLRSTAFTMTAGEDSITVTTRGYGHRVGMSQYGADAMAVSGSGYEEILAHYYQGTVLTRWAG